MTSVRHRLQVVLKETGSLAVAVSGGVDSMTLASMAVRVLGDAVLAVHAASPAVPPDATARVRALAAEEGWTLRVIEAGEFADPRYRANPVDRCFFCKTNLYGAIARVTERQIVSGANLDDLGEYRPGLAAAREHGVRHPFVESDMTKADVRRLARELGLVELAELPASPCLSSRVETGLAVEIDTLRFVHEVEQRIAAHLATGRPDRAIRCRVRASGIVVELDPASFATLSASDLDRLGRDIALSAPATVRERAVTFAPYRNGSAFLTEPREVSA